MTEECSRKKGRIEDKVQELLQQLKNCTKSSDNNENNSEQKSLLVSMLKITAQKQLGDTPKSIQKLLSQLVKTEDLNCLIVNLHPGNEGYSIQYPKVEDAETIILSYEESDFLEYLDSQQIPPFILDVLDEAPVNLYYDGHVVVELRDFRRNTVPKEYHTSYVILKPSQETLIADVNMIANQISPSHAISQEDMLRLEQKIIEDIEEPMCLDPSPSLAVVQNILEKDVLNSEGLVRQARKWNQASVARRRKYLSQCSGPCFSSLHDFLITKRQTSGVSSHRKLLSVDTFKEQPIRLSAPSNLEVMKYVNMSYERFRNVSYQVIEEWSFEREDSSCNVWNKLIVSKKGNVFVCQLSEYRANVENSLKSKKIEFSTREELDNHVQQFEKVFTESYTKSAIITHTIAGQAPKITKIEGKDNGKVNDTAFSRLSEGKITFQMPNSNIQKAAINAQFIQSIQQQQQQLQQQKIPANTPQLPTHRLRQMGIFAHVSSRSGTPLPQVNLTTCPHLPSYTQATAFPANRSPVSSVGIAQTITVSASQLTSIPHVQVRSSNQISPTSPTTLQVNSIDKKDGTNRTGLVHLGTQLNLIKPVRGGTPNSSGLSLLQLVSPPQLSPADSLSPSSSTTQQLYITTVQTANPNTSSI
ncbi:DgyrCDS3840 [Dimorphilus gyrociliatus]|uniref:DgyrCDS3840 n=1 Tax=Dimorphilus gyrociliatus TaxID=2664684 RepID=A0A7I8VHQ6_9ANNE|nr:DgyrCDS3840 [Dimorphilus gyrociliatus]